MIQLKTLTDHYGQWCSGPWRSGYALYLGTRFLFVFFLKAACPAKDKCAFFKQ